MKERITKLEEANVAPKPWMLSGEASAKDRPVDSLLDTDLDFDAATKV